ncbi:hypothetical protein I3843_12G015900 [Carya illinoinensis]|uniref:Uncharacterized protein n=1 Tax=Carya illinoinensis TaxID=32201 RepID=A0A8T1NVK7_CARIL|nr:uncharacterized protein LOC122289984 isoform X1 [Carya illinoinensis]KAG6632963.1 hypothetical protein CIPAW_12G015700 [Carya illinoinensis]KAG7951598.1 hypothetical protein I3843_12G015900 [Carya illinoinensis]
MEESSKDQTNTPLPAGSAKQKLQRYPLRSANKSKEETSPVAELPNLSASKRGISTASVSKSVGVLDLSIKDKSVKPPRRLSIPAKSTVRPAPKLAGNITPISEARGRSSATGQGKSDTPVSNVSRTTSRKKFSVLSSASYWTSQIKLSESAAKHSISLGFFKLALEAGCEPLQRMRDELKLYAQRYNLSEYGEPLKELFERYNISESTEQLQVSETYSQVPEEGTRSSDDDVHSSSSTVGTRKLKPRSLNTDATQASELSKSAKQDTIQKKSRTIGTRGSLNKNWGSLNKNSANSKSVSEPGDRKLPKKPEKPTKLESNKEKDKMKQGKKSSAKAVRVSTLPAENMPQEEENKENMDALPIEEISLTGVS